MAETDYRTTGVVTAPISLKAVAQLLGEKPDVAAVCKSARINMWAKWKPVMVNKPVPLAFGDYALSTYGLSWPRALPAAAFDNLFDGECNGWSYTAPGAPWRISDFVSPDRSEGYDHHAVPPFDAFDCDGVYDLADVDEVQMQIGGKNENPGGVTFSDLGMGGFWPGVVLLTPNGSYIPKVSASTLSAAMTGDELDGSVTIRIAKADLTTGTYRIYPAIFTQSNGSECIPVPNVQPGTLTIRNTSQTLYPGTQGGSGSVTVYINATYTNSARTQIKVSACWVNSGSLDIPIVLRVYIGTYENRALTNGAAIGGTISFTAEERRMITEAAKALWRGYIIRRAVEEAVNQ